MKQFNQLMASTILISLGCFSFCQAATYNLDFGLVLHDDNGEPVGFEKTQAIPLKRNGHPSLYGLVITNDDNEPFTLSSVHIVPSDEENSQPDKFLGKPMYVQKRGAIFMRTDTHDKPGVYQMEVYLNNALYQTITYELTTTSSQIAYRR